MILEFGVFLYGLLATFVLSAVQRNKKLRRPSPAMVTAVGWGLFSMSSTLALLFTAAAIALSLGIALPVDPLV